MARWTGWPRGSLRLDARFLRFPGPFGDLAFDVFREPVRVHGRDVESHDTEARLDVGLGDAPVDGVVEPVDDVARRAGGGHQAVPQDRLRAGQPFGAPPDIRPAAGADGRGAAGAFTPSAPHPRHAGPPV